MKGVEVRRLATAARWIVVSVTLIAVLLLLAACGGQGGGGGGTPSSTPATPAATGSPSPGATATPAPGELTAVALYFLRDGMIGVAVRGVPATSMPATAALTALLEGPDRRERAAGLTTAFDGDFRLGSVTIEGRTAFIDLTASAYSVRSGSWPGMMGQLVYTATQFPTVDDVVVEFQGKRRSASGAPGGDTTLSRADFEDITPAVLVESPAVGDTVTSPLTLTGTANTFEATFMAEVLDTNGARLTARTMVTATSGSGERGTFAAELPFALPDVMSGDGSAVAGIVLVVFETSAEDGSRIHEVRIPLTVAP
jgi:hypothetical protein